MNLKQMTTGVTVLGCVAALVACGGKREAESKTPVAEAEVSTSQPESAISDQALQNTADQAAVAASQPEPGATSTGSAMGDGTTQSTTTTTTNP